MLILETSQAVAQPNGCTVSGREYGSAKRSTARIIVFLIADY